MAAPMLVPLILLGGATVALAAASAKKKRAEAPGSAPNGRTYTLDVGMPAPLRDQVLAALAGENDATKLEAFASAIASQYPLAASALRTKAAMLHVPDVIPPLPAVVPRAPTPVAPPITPSATQDWQTQLLGIPDPPRSDIVRQLMGQNDPNALEAYARQLEAQYPIAAWALRVREAALRGTTPPQQPSAPAVPPVAPAAPAPVPPPIAPQSVVPPPAAPAAPPPAPVPVVPAAPLLGGLDPGMPPEMQKAVVGALTTETDPSKLEGFASAIQAQYPVAAGLLMAKAQALRLMRPPGGGGNLPLPIPALPIPPLVPPAAPPAPMMVLTTGTYTVKPGDFPIKIAQKLTGDGNRWKELIAANPSKKTGPDGNFVSLLPGEILKLPASWGTPKADPSPPQPQLAPAVLPAVLPVSSGTYRVLPGDFPIKIATKLVHDGSRWKELIAANPSKKTGPDGNFVSLMPGEILKLPASWVSAPDAPPAGEAHAANA